MKKLNWYDNQVDTELTLLSPEDIEQVNGSRIIPISPSFLPLLILIATTRYISENL